MTQTNSTDPTPTARRIRQLGDRKVAIWLWRSFVRHRVAFIALALALMAFEGAMLGAFSYLIQPMFDDVLIEGQRGRVYVVAIALASVFFARGLARIAHKSLMAWQGERATAELQTMLLAHLARQDLSFFQLHSPGVLIERVRGDSEALRRVFRNLITGLGRDGFAVLILLGVAVYTDWQWTLIAVVAIPLLVLPMVAIQRLIRRRSAEARVAAANSSNRLDEAFHGITTIQLTGTEAREVSRFAAIMDRFVKQATRAAIGQAAVPTIMDFGAAIGFALVLIYGGFQIIEGTRTVGQFMSFFTALGLLFDPMRRLSALSAEWQNVLASLERTYAILQVQPKVINPPRPHLPLPTRDQSSIVLDGINFAYGTDPVLRDFSMVAEAGKTTALVGPSGAGKSTVFALLTRLIDPDEGQVLIGGHEIRGMDLVGLRRLFAVVSQDTALFDESIRDNITMGAVDAGDAALQAALAVAHVDEFLPMLPQGLDTLAGPRGSGLSGGQRQRVAIARAVLRNAPILLLDEATSALDARSESLVQDALDKLATGRTTLVIAHRLSTVRNADKIVVMERGHVIEQGSHEDLLAADGAYARLYAIQFGSEDVAPQDEGAARTHAPQEPQAR